MPPYLPYEIIIMIIGYRKPFFLFKKGVLLNKTVYNSRDMIAHCMLSNHFIKCRCNAYILLRKLWECEKTLLIHSYTLNQALEKEYFDVADILMQNGLVIDNKDHINSFRSLNSFVYALNIGVRYDPIKSLIHACYKGYDPRILHVLLSSGDILQDTIHFCLREAVIHNLYIHTQILLEYATETDHRLLNSSCYHNYNDIALLLLNSGYICTYTALRIASNNYNLHLVESLLDAIPDVLLRSNNSPLRDNNGWIIKYAKRKRRWELVKLLKKYLL